MKNVSALALNKLLSLLGVMRGEISSALNAMATGEDSMQVKAIDYEATKGALSCFKDQPDKNLVLAAKALSEPSNYAGSMAQMKRLLEGADFVRQEARRCLKLVGEASEKALHLGIDPDVSDALPYDALVEAVDREIESLRQKVANGIRSEKGYVTTLKCPVSRAPIQALLIELKELERHRARSKSTVKTAA